MFSKYLKTFLVLALLAGGIQKLPCIQMGFSHDCCAVASSHFFSNPSQKCCDAKTEKGFPVLGASLSFQTETFSLVAVVDTMHPLSWVSLKTPLPNNHWGGSHSIPSYLEHVALLL